MVSRLDDQRASLPSTARIPEPAADVVWQMRTSIERDNASVVDRLRKEHDVSGSLHDLVVVVVARSGATEPRCSIGDAPNEVTEIFRARRWTRPGHRERRGVCRAPSLPSIRCHERNLPIRRIHDQRRSVINFSDRSDAAARGVSVLVHFGICQRGEKEIVSSSGVAVHVAPEEPRRVLPQRSHFLVGQESFSFERLRPFQRSGVVVQPDALKVWLAVRCPWRSPWFRCFGPRGRSLTGGKSRRQPDEHDYQSAQCRDRSMAHDELLYRTRTTLRGEATTHTILQEPSRCNRSGVFFRPRRAVDGRVATTFAPRYQLSAGEATVTFASSNRSANKAT